MYTATFVRGAGMPYNSVDEVPAYVKKKGNKKARQWMHVFNSAMDKYDDEERAFKMANGTVKEAEDVAVGEKYYLDSYDVVSRRETQLGANYKPLGGDSERACANCRWFVSPNQCVVVAGDISPTGLSDLYRQLQPQVQEAVPVTIVPSNVSAGVAETVVEKVITWFDKLRGTPRPDPVHVLTLKEVSDGRTRFFLRVSNNFVDRTKQTIVEAAHKEFVEWADKEQAYPELWVWHAKGSRLGEADWLDVCSGVLCASGYIDEGKEEIAAKAAELCDGTSHGFLYVSKANDIVKYRTFEISMLPNANAANNYFGNGLRLVQEDLMPFTETKKELLGKMFPVEQVAAMERETDQMVDSLKKLGIEYKEVDENQALASAVGGLTNAMGQLAGKLDEKFTGIDQRLGAMQKQIDEGVEQAMTPRVEAGEKGFVASKSDDNVVDDKTVPPAAKPQEDWFHNTVMGAIERAF